MGKLKNHFINNGFAYCFVLISITIVSLPLILHGLALHNDYFDSVVSGDTISYYGVALGIFSSFLIFQLQRKKEEENRLRELRPKIVIKVEIIDCNSKAYCLILKNIGSHTLKDVHFDGDFLTSDLLSGKCECLNLDCNGESDEWYEFDNEYEKYYRDGDNRGIPKFLTLQCTDSDDKIWCIEYRGYCSYKGISYQQEEM